MNTPEHTDANAMRGPNSYLSPPPKAPAPRIIRQVIRGCTCLPFVGAHPGTGTVIFFIFVAIAFGAQRGFLGALVSGAAMALLMVPIYLSGAYSRAQLSDKLARKHK